MKRARQGRIALTLTIVIALVWPTAARAQGLGPGENLAQRVSALEAEVAAMRQELAGLANRISNLEPSDFDVDCSAGQRINDALAQAASRTGLVRIIIHGICDESVVVRRSNTILLAGEPGVEIQQPRTEQPGGRPAVRIQARGVALNGLTLTGGFHTVVVDSGGSAVIASATVRDSGRLGVFAFGGSVTLNNSTVTGAGNSGVAANLGAVVQISRSTISNNAWSGVEVAHNSTAILGNGTVVTGNQREGAKAQHSSSLSLADDSTIENNIGHGVEANVGSTVHLHATATIADNGGHGVRLSDTSVMTAFEGAEITGNQGWGVYCSSPEAQVFRSAGDVSGNLNQAVFGDPAFDVLGRGASSCRIGF